MGVSLRSALDVSAPAAAVFAILTDPEQMPSWSPSIISARRVESGPIHVGSRCVVRGRLLGAVVESETEVVALEPNRLFATVARRGPKLGTSFRLEPLGAGCRVVVDVTGDVPGGRLGAVFAESTLRTEFESGLRRLADIAMALSRQSGQEESSDPPSLRHRETTTGK